MPKIQRSPPQTTVAMISRIEIDIRLSKVAPVKDELMETLASVRQTELPFYPMILVFVTGHVSEEDCLPMRRSPMPRNGSPFNENIVRILEEAFTKNPSIHDGAIVFDRSNGSEQYCLSAWSMRIVSRLVPLYSEPNLGSAYNSALSLSMANSVDMCCIIAKDRTTVFLNGHSHIVGSQPRSSTL